MILKSIGYTFGLNTLITVSSWLMKFKDGFSVVTDWMWTAYSWPFDGISGSSSQFELPYRYLDPEHKTLGKLAEIQAFKIC